MEEKNKSFVIARVRGFTSDEDIQSLGLTVKSCLLGSTYFVVVCSAPSLETNIVGGNKK